MRKNTDQKNSEYRHFSRSVVNKESESVSQVMTSQPAFTCSMLEVEALKQSVRLVKIHNKSTRTTP